MSPAVSKLAVVLSRLDDVVQVAPLSWVARCPTGDHDGQTLEVSLLDDGRIWLCCSACDAGALWNPIPSRPAVLQ